MAAPHTSPVQALIASHSVKDFVTHYWSEKHLVTHGVLARLPEFLRTPELSSFHALASKYRGLINFGSGPNSPHTTATERTSPALLFNMGLSVYLPDLVPYVTGAGAFLRQLEQELGIHEGAARMGAFASPRNDGVACHFDAEEVFSIQLQGSKLFHVAHVREMSYPYGMQFTPGIAPYNDMYPQVNEGFPDWKSADFETIEMQPGSVLYMPRGTWHRTEALEDSLSVSIILRPLNAVDCVLEQLRLLLLQDPQWRKPLYGAWGGGNLRAPALAHLRACLTELPEIATLLTAENVLLPSLSEAKRSAAITRESRFQKAPTARLEVEGEAGHKTEQIVYIKLRDSEVGEKTTVRLEVPAKIFQIIKWLGEQSAPFCAGELENRFPETPFTEHADILRFLMRGGLLKMLWFIPLKKGEANEKPRMSGAFGDYI